MAEVGTRSSSESLRGKVSAHRKRLRQSARGSLFLTAGDTLKGTDSDGYFPLLG